MKKLENYGSLAYCIIKHERARGFKTINIVENNMDKVKSFQLFDKKQFEEKMINLPAAIC